MRSLVAALIVVLSTTSLLAQEAKKPTRRYGIEPRLRDFPQTTPKDTLASVISAMEARNIDYLMAHLADPEYVDERVKQHYRGDFDQLVKEATVKLRDDPGAVRELQRFLKEGDWQTNEKTASVRLKAVPDRQVFLRKIDARWFLENRQKAESPKKDG